MKQHPEHMPSAQRRRGFSLIECLLAGMVIMIVIVAMMTFRYAATANAEHAENQLLAARSANLLLEAWRGQKADAAFDPLMHGFESDFEIAALAVSSLLDADPAGSRAAALHSQPGLNILGNYRIEVDQKQFDMQLLYGGLAGTPNLRSIHVLVVWQDRRGARKEYYLPTLSQS
jgi:type II secretory pathway pseudopilin PulG